MTKLQLETLLVASIYNPPQPFGRSTVAVTKAFLAKNPNTVLVAVAAILEGQNMIWTDTTGSAQRFATWLQSTVDKTTPLVTEFQAEDAQADDAWETSEKVAAASSDRGSEIEARRDDAEAPRKAGPHEKSRSRRDRSSSVPPSPRSSSSSIRPA